MAEETVTGGDGEVLAAFRELPFFTIFTEEDLERMRVRDAARIRRYRPGETIIEQGNYEKTFFVLLSGSVRIVRSGREEAVISGQGAVFGEMSFILGKARTASVLAAGETACLEVNLGYVDFLEGAAREEYLSKFYRLLAPVVAGRLGSFNPGKAEMLLEIRDLEAQIETLTRPLRERIAALREALSREDVQSDDEEALRRILDRRF